MGCGGARSDAAREAVLVLLLGDGGVLVISPDENLYFGDGSGEGGGISEAE